MNYKQFKENRAKIIEKILKINNEKTFEIIATNMKLLNLF